MAAREIGTNIASAADSGRNLLRWPFVNPASIQHHVLHVSHCLEISAVNDGGLGSLMALISFSSTPSVEPTRKAAAMRIT